MLEGENISFEEHRELQEVLMDPAHLDEYIVFRRERLPDGKFGGFLVASGEIAEEVYVSFKKDKQINKNATYYFCSPTNDPDNRQAWVTGVVE